MTAGGLFSLRGRVSLYTMSGVNPASELTTYINFGSVGRGFEPRTSDLTTGHRPLHAHAYAQRKTAPWLEEKFT